MTLWEHPIIGPIRSLPKHLRSIKVWKHFYDRSEHWEHVCGEEIDNHIIDGEKIAGVSRNDNPELPDDIIFNTNERLQRVLIDHHDRFYEPAYTSEMKSSETEWTYGIDQKQRHYAITPRSVFLVVQLDRPSILITAFRPHPPTQGVNWNEDDFKRYGHWYFGRKEAGMRSMRFVKAVEMNLSQANQSVPSSVKELWWLASAIGYARNLTQHENVNAALMVAEKVFRETDSQLVNDLCKAIAWDKTIHNLASALKEDQPEDFERVLDEIEEILAVANVINAEEQAESLLLDAEMLIAWIPANWDQMDQMISEGCNLFSATELYVNRFWESVRGATIGAKMRELPPEQHPKARLVNSLFPSLDCIERFKQMFSSMQNKAVSIYEWIQTSLNEISVAQLAPTMGDGVREQEYRVQGKPSTGAPDHLRLFVVDIEHPDGYEVTSHFSKNDGYLWRFNSNDPAALFVLFASNNTISGDSLSDVIQYAAMDNNVSGYYREISPTT